MVYYKYVIIVVIAAMFAACSSKSAITDKNTDNVTLRTAPPPPVIADIQPFKDFKLFEGKTFSMVSNKVSLEKLMFAIATDLGMNLMIDPDVDATNSITVNFRRTPVDEALRIIMDLSDAYFEIRGNVVIVKKYNTRHFSLPYMPASSSYDSEIGGDVFGGSGSSGGGSGSSGGGSGGNSLKGNFSVKFKRPEGTMDFYQEIEKNIGVILGTAVAAPAGGKSGDYYALNKTTGSLTVHTTRNKMTRIENFFKEVFPRATRQVLIEARILDVTLSDDWAYGIEWHKVLGSFSISQTLKLSGLTSGSLLVTDPRNSFSAMISAIAKYGNTETLANPRMLVMNGQTAMISAGTITPFWETETKENFSSSAVATYNTTYVRSNVLDGVLLGVTPFVNDDASITINIVPVATTIQESKSIVNADGVVVAEAPVLNIKEAGTTVRVDDGATVVMGGLINNVTTSRNTRIPILGDIPILGYLFRTEEKITLKRELVIFLKPTIVYTPEVTVR